ncbi:yeats-domain-containing protein [Hesseltinella vesiculosa]|uniref:Protein AF-9 homolog n=1 Tax=Hesseltinella vesiculosa TaxID=101127 RepID=A0A1X2GI56_9FUNG|nr:yeats-domain-containing protein [Hesseltinella vesiculosa]
MASNKRVKGLIVSRPIYYGNIATPITGKKPANPDHTHRWTVMVKGLNNEDLSYYIRKVVFKLHETYPNPLRSIEQPPFELTETGWGEFEIMIKIHFQPITSEKPVTLYHHLRLHPFEDDLQGQPWPKDKPVLSLLYDELVFNEPTEAFREVLVKNNAMQPNLPTKKPASKDPSTPEFSEQLEKEELERLDNAQKEVNAEIIRLKQRMAALDNE